jgi:peptidoglycan DL-endopeptidase CwlO
MLSSRLDRNLMRPLPPLRLVNRRFWLGMAMAAVAALAVHGGPGLVAADRYDRQIRSLQDQAAALAAQLRTLQAQRNGAAQDAVAVQARLAATETSLGDAQARLDRDNAALATTALRIHETDERLDRDRVQLSRLAVRLYKLGDVTTLNALLASQNMYELIDTTLRFTHVSGSLKNLVSRVATERRALADLREQQVHEEQEAAGVVTQLQTLREQQRSEEQQFEAEVASLTGEAAQVAGQSQAIVARIAAVRAQQEAAARAAAAAAARAAWRAWRGAAGVLPPFAFGPRDDAFPWGQCTWYVASLRDVTWGGDAWMWLDGARAAGMSTGMWPRPGAIVVWGRGNGYSGYGHVAYVVSVEGPTQFTVDEANYDEVPGDLDRRWIGTLAGVAGFIY